MEATKRGRPPERDYEILGAASRLADQVCLSAPKWRGHRGRWCQAYHHASDILHRRAGTGRSTVRLLVGYEPHEIEVRIERLLGWDRHREGVTP